MTISSNTFFAAAPAYGSADQFLAILQSLDSSVPLSTTTDNAQPGNVGWQLFGWSNGDLANQQISAQFFWNQVVGQLGAPPTEVVAETTPVRIVPTPVTQSQVANNQSTSVVGQAAPVTSTVNTTNNVVPVTGGTPGTPTTDTMIGGIDVTQLMSVVDPVFGLPYVMWAGGLLAMYMVFGSFGRGRG